MMKIQICKIRPEGMDCDESFAVESIGLTRKDNIRFVSPVRVAAKIQRAEDELLVDVHAQSRYESFCYRCLDDVACDWTTRFSLNCDIEQQTEFIDLDEDIRQELILNLPERILCQEDCKGLCIECGINLNTQECKHKHSILSGQ